MLNGTVRLSSQLDCDIFLRYDIEKRPRAVYCDAGKYVATIKSDHSIESLSSEVAESELDLSNEETLFQLVDI